VLLGFVELSIDRKFDVCFFFDKRLEEFKMNILGFSRA